MKQPTLFGLGNFDDFTPEESDKDYELTIAKYEGYELLRTLQEGDIIYQNSSHTALDGAEPPPPTYAAPRFGLPFRLDTKIVKTGNPMKHTQFFGLGALDGLSQQEQKAYKSILKDLRIGLEQDDRTHKAIREVVLKVADKYKGVSLDSEDGIITIKFPNARYKFDAGNITTIASRMGVRLPKKPISDDLKRLAIAKYKGFWLNTPLGDLPTVLNQDGYKVSFYSNDHEPPHVHVRRHGGSAIFQIAPVELRKNSGYSLVRLNKIRLILQENVSGLDTCATIVDDFVGIFKPMLNSSC